LALAGIFLGFFSLFLGIGIFLLNEKVLKISIFFSLVFAIISFGIFTFTFYFFYFFLTIFGILYIYACLEFLSKETKA
jgi:hypothetical protein